MARLYKPIGYWPAILWAIFIFVLTVFPTDHIPEDPGWDISADKLVHFALFCILTLLLFYGRSLSTKSIIKPQIASLLAFSALFGLLMEVVQLYIPYRSFSWLDFIADSLGVVVGYLIFKMTSSRY